MGNKRARVRGTVLAMFLGFAWVTLAGCESEGEEKPDGVNSFEDVLDEGVLDGDADAEEDLGICEYCDADVPDWDNDAGGDPDGDPGERVDADPDDADADGADADGADADDADVDDADVDDADADDADADGADADGADADGADADDADVDDADADDATTGPPNLAVVYDEVFQHTCIFCHTIRAPVVFYDEGLRDRLLQPSVQLPTMPYVTPGSLGSSYLWHKVAGTHLSVGGEGTRMPSAAMPLFDEELAILRAWIEAGAPD